jgi:anti-anti-sigma factor
LQAALSRWAALTHVFVESVIMKLSLASDDGQLVRVAVSGRVTQEAFGPVHEPLLQLLGPGAYARQVLLDFSDVGYMDSSGVGWLLSCHKRMKEAGGKLVLASPQPIVGNLLRMLRLDKVLEINDHHPPVRPGGAA